MNTISVASIKKYFADELARNPELYFDSVGETNPTLLAENAQDHFDVMTETGNSEIEQTIFDLAIDFMVPLEKKK